MHQLSAALQPFAYYLLHPCFFMPHAPCLEHWQLIETCSAKAWYWLQAHPGQRFLVEKPRLPPADWVRKNNRFDCLDFSMPKEKQIKLFKAGAVAELPQRVRIPLAP